MFQDLISYRASWRQAPSDGLLCQVSVLPSSVILFLFSLVSSWIWGVFLLLGVCNYSRWQMACLSSET